MRKRYVVCALALIVALCFALPAVGASPAKLATKALGLSKKANKRAKSAAKKATSAQAAATGARTVAGQAQAAANAARSQASAAQSAASGAQSLAGEAQAAAIDAQTSARQVYRDTGPTLATSGPTTVATMSNVDPGSYVIMAKTDVYAGGSGSGIVQCEVDAGGSTDFANAPIGDATNAVFEATLHANVVHKFTSAGSIVLSCTSNMSGTGTATAQETKIIAMKVAGVSSSAVSG